MKGYQLNKRSMTKRNEEKKKLLNRNLQLFNIMQIHPLRHKRVTTKIHCKDGQTLYLDEYLPISNHR